MNLESTHRRMTIKGICVGRTPIVSLVKTPSFSNSVNETSNQYVILARLSVEK